jgi:hypothetical protein
MKDRAQWLQPDYRHNVSNERCCTSAPTPTFSAMRSRRWRTKRNTLVIRWLAGEIVRSVHAPTLEPTHGRAYLDVVNVTL